MATPEPPGPPKLKMSEPMRLPGSPLAFARISAIPIVSPLGSDQSRGTFKVAHCHSAPPGRGEGALPPPWASDGAGHAFQSSFCAVRSSSLESPLQPDTHEASRTAVTNTAAARGDGFGMFPILRAGRVGRSGHEPCG